MKQQFEEANYKHEQLQLQLQQQCEALTSQLAALQQQQAQQAAQEVKASETQQALLQNVMQSLQVYESWSRAELEEVVSHCYEPFFHSFKQETLALYDKVKSFAFNLLKDEYNNHFSVSFTY